MKYIVVIGDGMADLPLKEFGEKTPLQIAKKEKIDIMAQNGVLGLAKTVPEGMPPGSDVANLSLIGYNPKEFYTGRSPLEAASVGIELEKNDVAIRCNFVTLSDEKQYSDKTIMDYCSDEISTKEANELIKALNEQLKTGVISFYTGISYRHCLVWKDGLTGLNLIPPHDITGKKIKEYLPKSNNENKILDLMVKSYAILKDHPVNKARIEKGLNPANSIWLWGEGKKTNLPNFKEKTNLSASMISAVDLLKGIAICGGIKVVEVEGATGNIHTNFKGKTEAAIKELEDGQDFVFLHIEAPDECSHRNELDNKIKSIEIINDDVISPILDALEKYDDYKLLFMPDHPTPISLLTHTSDPVPFLIYQKSKQVSSGVLDYSEESAKSTKLYIEDGYKILDYFIKGVE